MDAVQLLASEFMGDHAIDIALEHQIPLMGSVDDFVAPADDAFGAYGSGGVRA